MSSVIDVNDLIRGEGEWLNMQDVVRKAFRNCLDVQNAQNEKISKLSSQVTQLRDELNRRPSYDDIERLIDLKILTDKKRSASSSAEVDALRLSVAQLGRELEKRVSLQHFQAVMSKKMDRSDVLLKDLSKSFLEESEREVAKVKLDLLDLRAQVDGLSAAAEERTKTDAEYPRTAEQVVVLKSQVENLYRHVNDSYSKEQVQHLLREKVNRIDLDTMLATKADTAVVFAFTAKLEQALEQHEKLITALRLSASDPSLFHNDVFLSGSSRLAATNGRRTSAATSSSAADIVEFEDALKDGRIESVISGLWSRMNTLLKDYDGVKKMLKSVDEEIKAFRVVVRGAAALDKVEVLAVVVEEQRLRIDSIIQGSTKISPIHKELRRFDERIKEINAFLGLPQPKKLKEKLDEISSFCKELSNGLMDVGNAVNSSIAPELTVMASRLDTLDARWEAGLHDRERVEYILDHINLAGTKFENVREIAHSLREAWATIDSQRLGDASLAGQPSMVNRLTELEEFQSVALMNIETHRQKIQSLKEILISMGAPSSDTVEISRPFAPHKTARRRLSEPVVNPPVLSEQRPATSEQGAGPPAASTSSLPTPAVKEPIYEAHPKPPTPSTNVDFEAVLGQLFHSLEDMKVPIRSSPGRKSSRREAASDDTSDIFMMSITDVDARLAELNREKQRIRQTLFSNL